MSEVAERAAERGATSAAAAYEAAKRVARGGDEAARTALAVRPTTPPELLYFLATDSVPLVRAAVAANAATPPQADRRLAEDADPRIRGLLGRKLAPLAPRLAFERQDRLRGVAWDTLLKLAADTAVSVRAIIADELKDLPDAPRELILRLAHDASMDVAEPVIRCSPVLTDDDLLRLVQQPPVWETVTAVARRPGLSEALTDAIVAAARPAAIAALLENSSAAIREATLDGLVADAAAHTGWQESLVARPVLSAAATHALATAIADHLLEKLASRPDLDPAVTALLQARIAKRLATAVPMAPPTKGAAAFLEASQQGDRHAMRRVLAKAAKVPPTLVERAERMRSPKALLGLAYAAGFSPALGLLSQTVLAGLSPQEAMPPTEAGGWPIGEDELRWQVEALGGGHA